MEQLYSVSEAKASEENAESGQQPLGSADERPHYFHLICFELIK